MRTEDEQSTVGFCDFTPGWHGPSGKLLGFGHTVRYQDGKLMKDTRPRETAWSVYDAESGTWRDLTRQPRTCHLQALRQVLTPLGLFNCPAHRGAPKARIAGRDAYADAAAFARTTAATAAILDRFDASHECAEVTCLYHGANWWLEHAISDADPAALSPAPATEDWFL